MTIFQSLVEALESLTSNKLRSSLTILGIVIGVAAVIAMLAIGRGAQDSITSSIQGIGTNLIFISSGNNSNKDVRNPRPLTMQDATAMTDKMAAPHVAAVAPVMSGSATVTFNGQEASPSVNGITPDYARVTNEEVTEGTFITQDQVLGRSAVAVIGPDTAKKLFGRSDGVVDNVIRVNNQPFRVVGVLKSKGGGGFGSQDDRILVPITTFQSRFPHRGTADSVSMIEVEASASDTISQATDEISQILRVRHRTAIGLDDFTIFTQDQILSATSSILGVLTIFLGGIAAISLLVGGIGIMNIMLVSVTERTREIGLRKAIGARKRDILLQFLTESVVLSLFGGIVGIGLAWVIATIVGIIAQANNAAITPRIELSAVLLATLFSMGVGLLFGLYPANRAANLQPVEALRYE
jgi:putative ABC transport system permease protein